MRASRRGAASSDSFRSPHRKAIGQVLIAHALRHAGLGSGCRTAGSSARRRSLRRCHLPRDRHRRHASRPQVIPWSRFADHCTQRSRRDQAMKDGDVSTLDATSAVNCSRKIAQRIEGWRAVAAALSSSVQNVAITRANPMPWTRVTLLVSEATHGRSGCSCIPPT